MDNPHTRTSNCAVASTAVIVAAVTVPAVPVSVAAVTVSSVPVIVAVATNVTAAILNLTAAAAAPVIESQAFATPTCLK